MELAAAQDLVESNLLEDWKHDYYSKTYRRYELNYLPHLVERLKPLSPTSAIDVGPGWGTMMLLLASWGWRVTVMDREPRGHYIPEKTLSAARAEYLHADIFDPPPLKADLVLCTQVLLHLKYRPDRAVANVARMLPPEGLAILTALNPERRGDPESAYGAQWRRMPIYGEAEPVEEIVTCLLPEGVFRELLETAFAAVTVTSPGSVMFAECRSPRNGI